MRSAGIKSKPLFHTGAAETTDLWFCFKDNNLLIPFMEEAGQGKT